MEKGEHKKLQIYNEQDPLKSTLHSLWNCVPAYLHFIMKFLYFAILALVALDHAKGGKVQGKRGVAGYTAPTAAPAYVSAAQGQVAYAKVGRPVLEQKTASDVQQYVPQAAAYATPTAQQYYQAEPQAVAYAQPAVSKYVAAPAVQKIAFAQPQAQTPRRPQQYSSAADVSSFSYSSPIVAYNNFGFLRQLQGQKQPVQAAAASSYPTSPAVRVQYAAPSTYQTDSNAYDVYQGATQKAAYSEYPQVQAQPQASTYQTAPANQKIIYQTVPAYQVQAAQKVAPQVSFAPSQQYTYQAAQAAPAQNYEAAAQSAPQVFYSQPAPQPQYYSAASQAKFADPDVIYGH